MSLFSVTMLQIIQMPTPLAIGNHSQAISSSHIGDLLCTPSSALWGHAGPYDFTIVQCILCINASGAASGFTGGLSSTIRQGTTVACFTGSRISGRDIRQQHLISLRYAYNA
jgi:hypothetical protein